LPWKVKNFDVVVLAGLLEVVSNCINPSGVQGVAVNLGTADDEVKHVVISHGQRVEDTERRLAITVPVLREEEKRNSASEF
jgi:hypothetical protein